jgi:multiple sugar transport system substrate-binding protein
MPREIDISLISTLSSPGTTERMLKEFETQGGMQVHLQKQTWSTAWAELVHYTIYKNAPDVSEIGSTWISDLIGMNALRPFTQGEIISFGGSQAFFPSAWNSGVGIDGQVWSIPWLIDSRLLYYRRDLLEKASVDPATAFQTHEALVATLQRLTQAGIEIPWATPTHKTRMSLHNVASWVWGAGGRFISGDGKRALFTTPEALTGFRQYFELGRFLSPHANELDDVESDRLFWKGQVAVTLSGPWLLSDPSADPEIIANTGACFPPGVPFIGGSSLVVWQSSPRTRDALALVRYLTSQQVQSTYLSTVGLLPARQEAFSSLSSTANPVASYISQGLKVGRSFPLFPLWGLVEERLSSTLGIIWQEFLSDPKIDLAELIERDLGLLARRLDLALNGR